MIMHWSILDNRMLAASCEEHNSLYPSYWDFCFDGCVTQSRHCEGDQLIICDGATELVYDCVKVCRYQTDGVYSGECGSVSSNGEISDIGAVCWCQVW